MTLLHDKIDLSVVHKKKQNTTKWNSGYPRKDKGRSSDMNASIFFPIKVPNGIMSRDCTLRR